MTKDQEAFEAWLDQEMPGGETRREFAKEVQAKSEDLLWAFCAGYLQGRQDEREVK